MGLKKKETIVDIAKLWSQAERKKYKRIYKE